MPSTDWRDALAALRPDTPSAPETDSAPEPAPDPDTAPARRAQKLSIFYERKGRGGKQATIVAGFTCSDDELRAIASSLKQTLGTGGSARGGEILIQGDRRDDVAAALRKMGFRI